MIKEAVAEEISRLELLDKQGESYTNSEGRYGWRNPIRQDTGNVLTSLVLAKNPQRILEIGTAHGLSTLYLVMGLNPSKGVVHTIEFDAEVAESTQRRMDRLQVPVTVLEGEAEEVIAGLDGLYDVVFFDAQKNKYYDQLIALLKKGCVGPGTLILADNVSDRREECLNFLNWFTENGISHTIIETECGLLVASI
jgi:predicted O-methyltransferase YrrM